MADSVQTQKLSSKRNEGQTIGYRVYRSKGGARTPLFLIQGMSAVGTVDWHDLASVLVKDRTVVTLDNRDMHDSGWTIPDDKKSFSLQDMADDVVELAQYLGFTEIDICGHSMGGMIAQTLLVTPNCPVKIRHVILGATCAKAPRSDLGIAVATEMKKQAQSGSSDKRTPAERKRQLTEVFMKYCYDPEWIKQNPGLYERRVQESIGTRRPARTVALQQRAIGKYDVRQKLGSIPTSLPVLVIHGGQDVAVYPAEKDDILKSIKHAKLAECPRMDFGHNWYDYFDLEFWRSTIAAFLDAPQLKL